MDSTFESGFELKGSLHFSNSTYYMALIANPGGAHPHFLPWAVAGPCELVMDTTAIIHFARITNSSIAMVFWDGHSNNVSASVPQGKTIEFFHPMGHEAAAYQGVTVRALGQTYANGALLTGQRFDGPATIEFDVPTLLTNGIPAVIGSYWFIQDVFKNPNAGIVVNDGTPTVTIERSGDLKNWEPVAAFGAGLGDNANYRLSIGR